MDGEEFSIPWDAEPSFVVTEIVAIDADSGRNQKLTYHISDAKKLFGVDSIKGVIFVRDRDIFKFKDKRFPIEVRVSDNGLSTNHVVQQNFIYFDGNVTLYNHTAPGPPDIFDIDAQMPRIMVSLMIKFLKLFLSFLPEGGRERKFIPAIPWGGRRTCSSAFLSGRYFVYYFLMASYGFHIISYLQPSGQLETVAQGHKGLTAHRCSFCFAFLRRLRYFLSLGMPLR